MSLKQIFSTLILAACFSLASCGSDDEPGGGVGLASGKCGTNITWTLDSKGNLVLTGKGKMADYVVADERYSPWDDYCEDIKTVTISEGITTIGQEAFVGCENITSVKMPSSLTKIGDGAFVACSNLKTVTIPEGVTSIGSEAFCDCVRLISIDLPSSVTSIGYAAFGDCTSLEKVVIPEGVKTIEYNLFYGCTNLEDVTIPSSVTYIGSKAFSGCSNLEAMDVLAKNPPKLESSYSGSNGYDQFESSSYSYCEVLVPSSSVSKYKSAAGWKNFKYIIGD